MKTWSSEYKGHSIVVQNGLFSGEQLIVDGQLQDEQLGFALRARLHGKITNPTGVSESIKVSLGGWLSVDCRIFVDDQLLPSKRT